MPKTMPKKMKYSIFIATLTLGLSPISHAQKQAVNPQVLQTYLEQCVQVVEFSRDVYTFILPQGITTCESKVLGDAALKKPVGVRSSSMKITGYIYTIQVMGNNGKTLSNETDPATYNSIVIRRKSMQVAMTRAVQSYLRNCFMSLNALYADRPNMVDFPTGLNTCESKDLEPFAQKRPALIRSSRVGPKDPEQLYDPQNLSIEVVLESGEVYVWDGQNAVLKP